MNAFLPPAGNAPVTCPQPSWPDMRWLNDLPHRDSAELRADNTAPRAARDRLAKVLPAWSLPEFETVAALVASELLTNAVRATLGVAWAGPRPPVRLWLCGAPAVLVLLAWDATPAPPVPRDAGDEDESGRGLAIVANLTAAWGYYYPSGLPGKVTWAVINTP